jgi:hypothetical protein
VRHFACIHKLSCPCRKVPPFLFCFSHCSMHVFFGIWQKTICMSPKKTHRICLWQRFYSSHHCGRPSARYESELHAIFAKSRNQIPGPVLFKACHARLMPLVSTLHFTGHSRADSEIFQEIKAYCCMEVLLMCLFLRVPAPFLPQHSPKRNVSISHGRGWDQPACADFTI